MLLKRKTVDITEGPLFRSILLYTIPVIIGALISNLFHSAVMIVLGNMASVSAVSAVGVTSLPISLIVNSFIGLGTGVTIQLSRATGAGDHDRVRRIVNTSVLSALFIGVLVAVLGLAFQRPILRAVNCPESIIEDAALYMTIYFAAAPAILIYNFGASILRVHGDTERPLYYLIASGVLNVILNVLLCLVLERKVAAVALATLVSQVLGAVLVIARLCRGERGDMHLSLRHLSFDYGTMRRILTLGLPGALSTSIFSLANLPVQQQINSFGEAVIAGNNACTNIEALANGVVSGFATAVVAFMGQNIGANKPDRVKKSFFYCTLTATAFGVAFALLTPLVGRQILSLYVPDETAIEIGYLRMQYVISCYFVQGLGTCSASAIQAFGRPMLSTSNGLLLTLGFRYAWMLWIFPIYGTINNIYLCILLSWASKAMVLTAISLVLLQQYKKGKIKKV